MPLTVEPDRDQAAQRLADQWGMLVVCEGRWTGRTQDCECVPTSDACPDDDEGRPCDVVEQNECWMFLGFDDTAEGRNDAAEFVKDRPGEVALEDSRIWEPVDEAVPAGTAAL